MKTQLMYYKNKLIQFFICNRSLLLSILKWSLVNTLALINKNDVYTLLTEVNNINNFASGNNKQKNN